MAVSEFEGDLASVLRVGSILPVHNTQHGRHQIDGKDVIGISEETDTGHDDGADMVPAEGSLVDFGKSKASSLVGVLDVSKVILDRVSASRSFSEAWLTRDECFGVLTWKLWKAALPPAVLPVAMVGEDEVKSRKLGLLSLGPRNSKPSQDKIRSKKSLAWETRVQPSLAARCGTYTSGM